ncbi:hypothetical protein [Cohnella caldifontis]|uniref:hypothetical protein n=1 Tax=Cohnella caldifontis TaxID=3027471 RepID=UPI0023EA8AB7|nr:hypothetical protein [Cohnella sp. YIM B05605]
MIIHKASDVYGISREIPINYVSRAGIDDVFKSNLNREKHIVVFGSSKQGKTSLRKKCLSAEDYIVIHCSNKWNLEDINSNILKRAGYELTQSTKKTTSGKYKIIASLKTLIPIGTAGLKAEAERGFQKEIITNELELDVEDVNDIISALNAMEFKKIILLEDFHYLPIEVQRDFSIALKAFHENSNFCFIVVGVWLDENRLIIHNGDLTGRIVSINADKWNKDQLLEVIEEGEKLLNISFSEDFKRDLLSSCYDNVYIVQEACYLACLLNEIKETQIELREIDNEIRLDIIVKLIVDQQSGRYNSFITNFSDGFQSTLLEMYKWLLYPVLISNTDQLERGIKYSDIRKIIATKHPKGDELNPGNITQALKSTASLQITKGIQPIILDYDETNLRLHVVDRGFLIWLNLQNRAELLELAGLPNN